MNDFNYNEVLSLIISLWSVDLSQKNLRLNLGQNDKDDIMQKLDEQTKELLSMIQHQIKEQNAILYEQTKLLKEIKKNILLGNNGE